MKVWGAGFSSYLTTQWMTVVSAHTSYIIKSAPKGNDLAVDEENGNDE